jgi:primosomal protein N' (replication factor Y)
LRNPSIDAHVLVAVPVPNLDLLTYAVPSDVPSPVVGARVVVPLGSRVVTGIVIETNVSSDVADGVSRPEIKPLRQVLDSDAFVPPDVIALARWTADYYAAGVGDTIPAVLPPMARGARVDAHKTTRVAAITAAGLEALSAEQITDKQREVLALLAGTPTGIPTPALAGRGISADTVSRLAKHGYLSLRHDRLERDPFEEGRRRDGGGTEEGRRRDGGG